MRADLVHVSTDLETRGLRPGAVVLTAGLVAFHPDVVGEPGVVSTLFLAIEREASLHVGLHEERATCDWWEQQRTKYPDAYAEAHSGTLRPGEACEQLEHWWKANHCEYIWGHGKAMDVALLDAVFFAVGRTPPWHFTCVRDTRTLYDITGEVPLRNPATHHKALEDARQQAYAIQRGFSLLRAWAEEYNRQHGILKNYGFSDA